LVRCVGGGWHQSPSVLPAAGILGLTVVSFSLVLCVIAATYCFIRRPWAIRRRLNAIGRGATAVDYMRHSDGTAQMPSPPPYCADTAPLPPPYSPTGTSDKPPDYEVVLLQNGTCVYRPCSADCDSS